MPAPTAFAPIAWKAAQFGAVAAVAWYAARRRSDGPRERTGRGVVRRSAGFAPLIRGVRGSMTICGLPSLDAERRSDARARLRGFTVSRGARLADHTRDTRTLSR